MRRHPGHVYLHLELHPCSSHPDGRTGGQAQRKKIRRSLARIRLHHGAGPVTRSWKLATFFAIKIRSDEQERTSRRHIRLQIGYIVQVKGEGEGGGRVCSLRSRSWISENTATRLFSRWDARSTEIRVAGGRIPRPEWRWPHPPSAHRRRGTGGTVSRLPYSKESGTALRPAEANVLSCIEH